MVRIFISKMLETDRLSFTSNHKNKTRIMKNADNDKHTNQFIGYAKNVNGPTYIITRFMKECATKMKEKN